MGFSRGVLQNARPTNELVNKFLNWYAAKLDGICYKEVKYWEKITLRT